jgi:hypothetical protein
LRVGVPAKMMTGPTSGLGLQEVSMIRKLIVLSLLILGIGFASSASATVQCDCDTCADLPGINCYWVQPVVMKCSDFYRQYCPN